MSKLDNHVFLSICEISLECFKRSKFLTYINYCRNMAFCIDNNNLSSQQMTDLFDIMEYLDVIYSFESSKMNEYILDFFKSERILDFEKYVTINNKVKPKF